MRRNYTVRILIDNIIYKINKDFWIKIKNNE